MVTSVHTKKETYMTIQHGFELVKEAYIKEISSHVRHFRHIKTGAELVSVENSDDNKSFGVAFQTPAPDDTGLPHILEHSVLAGSRKYPLKEPFVELIKTSLNTFVNAMTFPDMTVYPVASANLKDFYNLVDVYLDAVFYPLITEKVFQQEGWHYEAENPDAPLTYKGVVFNEMKGYFSTPEIILSDEMRSQLLPDTPYANNSGGNPAHIPDLTYEQFKQYHATYYHPSNARFFFYGDDNPEERLHFVNDFIQDFERKEVDSRLPLQPRWNQPRRVVIPVDAGEHDADSNKGLMTVNWLLTEVTNTQDIAALNILNHVLMGSPAYPLYAALLESGLGEDLSGGGLDTYGREAVFSIGMKGITSNDAPTIEALILETLGNLAEEGIDKDIIEASLNTIEFSLREKNTGRFPRGLAAFLGSLPQWLNGADPIEVLSFEDDLQYVRNAYAQDERFFENLIGKYFLENNHRVTITMQPDSQVKPKREAAEVERLAKERAVKNADDIAHIIKDAEILRMMQEAPDKPEDLAKLPTLKLSDLERNIKTIPLEELKLANTKVLFHDIPTNGVVYVDLAFNLKGLPVAYVPYVSLFAKALIEMGTKNYSFIDMQNLIGAKTGGIGASENAMLTLDRQTSIVQMVMRAKSMSSQASDMFNIVKELLLNVNFDDQERIMQMVLEDKAQFEAYLGLSGHSLANMRLRAQFDEPGWFTEMNSGTSQLFFLRELAERIESDWENVLGILNHMRELMVNRAGLLFNITVDADTFKTLTPTIEGFLNDLPHNPLNVQTWQRSELPKYEGLAVPTQVNFVGKAANLYDLGYELNSSHNVILKHFNLTYMWTKIRVQGGAYGGSFGFNPLSGVGVFVSWQDPNIVGTLANYDASADFLANIEISDEELEKAIIGAIGQVDSYLLPDALGAASMTNYLIGNNDTLRQKRRDEIFATTRADFHKLAQIMRKVAEKGYVVVTSATDRLEKANEQLNTPLQITKVL
jgi:presequence protease